MNSLSLPHLQNTHLNTRLPTRIMSISDIKIYLNLHLSLQIQFRLRQDLHTCLIRLLRQIPSSAHDETIRPNGHFERSTSTLADSILLPPVSELPIVHMLTRTMVLQKKPQYNTWHRTTTVRWLYSILVSRYPSSATIWRLKMKCFDIRWEINFYQKTFRSQIFHLGTRDHSEFYKHASVFALNTNTNQMA